MQNYRFVFSLSSAPSKSLDYSTHPKFDTCVPSSIFGVLPSHTPQPHHYENNNNNNSDAWKSEWTFLHRRKDFSATSSGKQPAVSAAPAGESDWRYGPISIEWFDIPRRKNRGKKPPLKESMAAAAAASSSSSGARGEASSGSRGEKGGVSGAIHRNVTMINPDLRLSPYRKDQYHRIMGTKSRHRFRDSQLARRNHPDIP